MADTRSTLLECSVKIRQGRKWKSRWCVLTRQSPVSAEVILKFYKDQSALVTNKELSRERFCVSATNYCGLECGYRHPKNVHVLTIVLSESVVLLSFPTHERLLEWYHKIKITLPSASEFKERVSIPNKGKLPSGRASLYFYNNHMALTPETPVRLICAWNLSTLIRYGTIEGGIAFTARLSKGSVNHILLTDNAANIILHFDAATSRNLPNRWSMISDTHHPAIRGDFHGTHTPESQRLLSNTLRDGERTEQSTETGSNVESRDGDRETDPFLNAAERNETDSRHSVSEFRTMHNSEQYKSREDIAFEMLELQTRESSRTDVDRSEASGTLHEETDFGHSMLMHAAKPTKTDPIRDQEYEVMASFDHYRSSMYGSSDMGSQNILRHAEENRYPTVIRKGGGIGGGGCSMSSISSSSRLQNLVNSGRFRIDSELTPEEAREYVNLPSPLSTVSSNAVTYSPRVTAPRNQYLPNEIITTFDFSPPSTPPPVPPIHRSSTTGTMSSKEAETFLDGYHSIGSARASIDLFSSLSDILVQAPFTHGDLVRPTGPIARLKRASQDSETSSFMASGSEYDSSQFSSAASSRHNSFGQETLSKPPPIPPKSADKRLPSIDALLSSGKHDPSKLDRLVLSSSPQALFNVPPIPPKPDHLRGRPLMREPPSPTIPVPGSRPPSIPHRTRCNTEPSFASLEGDTEWIEAGEEGDEGYLIMKPVYEDKLKGLSMHVRSRSVPDEGALQTRTLPPMPHNWMSSNGALSPSAHSPGTFFPRTPTYSEPSSPYQEFIPSSPIHSANDMRISMLKRSATIGGHRTRTTRSPSFVGRRPSLVRSARQRQSITSLSTTESRTSDISLNGVPMPRVRRRDKYASLDHRSVSRRSRQEKRASKDQREGTSASPAPTTPVLPDTLEEGKDEVDQFAGTLSLSPPSSVNTSPASSIESLNTQEE